MGFAAPNILKNNDLSSGFFDFKKESSETIVSED